MAELRPVAGPRSPFEGNAGRILALIVIGVVVAVVKPWGDGGTASTASPGPARSSTPSVAAPTTPAAVIYDEHAFGPIQPQARWEIWPAGRLISFSFTMRVADDPTPSTPPIASAPPALPSQSPGASASPAAYVWPGTETVAEAWPREVRVPGASILHVLGLSHPASATVDVVALLRFRDDGTTEAVPFLLGPSPWPDHFLIVGVAADAPQGGMQPWPPGHYRLDVTIGPAELRRSIDIYIDPAPEEVPTLAPATP